MNTKEFQFLLLFGAIWTIASARKLCREDPDCSSLGDLKCIKSACSIGICGCERGKAARFLGTPDKYQCIPLRRIGEKCSTDDNKGVCAASNSDCVEGRCRCQNGFESKFGGEDCMAAGNVAPSESSSSGLGSNCDGSSHGINYYGDYLTISEPYDDDYYVNFPLDRTPPSCVCQQGYRTGLNNDYDASPRVGAKIPVCVKNAVGDTCLVDADCGEIVKADQSTAECVNNVCECGNAAYTYDITGLFCAPVLSRGATCMTSHTGVPLTTGVCDGSLGLRCGSPCDLDTLYGSGNYSCECDPGWEDNGSSCSKVAVGSPCTGDQKCKSIGPLAVCTDGKCEETSGAEGLLPTLGTLGLTLVVFLTKLSG